MAKLSLLLKLESDKEERLRADFLSAQQHHRLQQQKLQGLTQFRGEYMSQLMNKAQAGLSSAGFSHYQNFIAKIEQAIAQQSHTVETADKVTQQRQQQWQQQRIRAEAVAKLIAKQEQQKQAVMAKAEQKMLDEFSTNQFFARRLAQGSGS
ncbi:flagellar export protein FliJ [Pseudoalteromonas sp. BDTF-M6]|uniref:flagellar export protein FliJ n=1 Tax=Pseudoalteromonas sp. BDTF-M6 TaxID=2796132 RepID=UPI001BAE7A63|nr:flagellar export protein FliJ [Pseudoalteromonas sp. BDTF-M6]